MPVVRLLLVVALVPILLTRFELRAEEEPAAPAIDDLAWLAGTWRNEEGVMPFEETWTAPWGGVLHLHLRHFDAGLKPWASEKDPLVWTLAESEPNRAVFRHASRAFPREIVYERDGDTLRALLAGVQGGQETRMGFELTHVSAE